MQKSGAVIIESVGFSCSGYGIAAGVAPTSLGKPGTITHYSIFFQPSAAITYDCNFVMTLGDSSVVNVPLTGAGLAPKTTVSTSPTALTFASQKLGSTSAGQTFTITNTGNASMNLNTISVEPPDFTTSPVTLPYAIAKGASLTVTVNYSPSHVGTENGVIDLAFNEVPDQGVTLTGNGIAATALSIATFSVLPQATASAAYSATLATSAGTGPFCMECCQGLHTACGFDSFKHGCNQWNAGLQRDRGNLYLHRPSQRFQAKHRQQDFHPWRLCQSRRQLQRHFLECPNSSTPMRRSPISVQEPSGPKAASIPMAATFARPRMIQTASTIADAIQALDSNGNPIPPENMFCWPSENRPHKTSSPLPAIRQRRSAKEPERSSS